MTPAAARKAIREAYALGWSTDALVLDYATERLGGGIETRALVERVFDRDFAVKVPN